MGKQSPATPVGLWSFSILNLEDKCPFDDANHVDGRRRCVRRAVRIVVTWFDLTIMTPLGDVELGVLLDVRCGGQPGADIGGILTVLIEISAVPMPGNANMSLLESSL